MTQKTSPWRIGLFTLVGLALLVAAGVAVLGTRLFTPTERGVMHFSGSVYGLQVGSPVVFRGVRVGSVRSMKVSGASGRFAVPVEAELDRTMLQTITGNPGGGVIDPLFKLVGQGLAAQLATQSLLTGQLYIDLDLRLPPGPTQRDSLGRVEIPTSLTRFQSLRQQLDRVDVSRMSQGLAATLAAARGLVAGPEIKQMLAELAQASTSLARVTAALDKRLPALADTATGTMRQAGDASARVGGAAERVSGAADRVGAAAERADTLLQPGSPMVISVLQAADELARTATALRAATGDESASLQSVQRAMGDVSRAARSVRSLADQIEAQPQSLIRGRTVPP